MSLTLKQHRACRQMSGAADLMDRYRAEARSGTRMLGLSIVAALVYAAAAVVLILTD